MLITKKIVNKLFFCRNETKRKALLQLLLLLLLRPFPLYLCSLGFGQGLWVSTSFVLCAHIAGPVELKWATLGSEDRPRVGGGPGVGSPGPEKEPVGGRGPRPLGARGGHAMTRSNLVVTWKVIPQMGITLFIYHRIALILPRWLFIIPFLAIEFSTCAPWQQTNKKIQPLELCEVYVNSFIWARWKCSELFYNI